MSASDDRYNHSRKGRARWRRYDQSERGRERKREWKRKADLRKSYQHMRAPFTAWLKGDS
jgi:hypothetical protein